MVFSTRIAGANVALRTRRHWIVDKNPMMQEMYIVHFHFRYDIVIKPPVKGDAKGPTNTAMANISISTPRV